MAGKKQDLLDHAFAALLSDDDAKVLAAIRNGINVIQGDLEGGLADFETDAFQHVILSQTLQAMRHTENIINEMLRVGREAIVSFPNFGHWTHAWSILKGRMPVSREMPFQWYDTPNLHLSTLKDFEDFLDRLGLAITRRGFLEDGRPVGWLPGLRCTQAIYSFRVR